ncbi:LytR/AlgR family response regulator transcription factor [Halobacillus amylolyticus]|uniref:LytTR family DNA-binding domain-containing protein n=1 Tax=Halobacillus amylolyticus TaxID=2932259 RepID=A0ABY4H686_9BACI|nr:LytTR family DNA-binding domain-containing protein [Halobacillus amylolyticus]UOR10376.1 LytTR family DNA-binding domain-containing protein [Halobacillus amylolyticus]
MSIRAIVVDDERFSREELIFLIEHYPSVEVVGEADSGEVAIMKTIQLQPDVLFLDVEMPKMDGMEVAKSVQELKKVPEIVFATAYSDFAVEAFRHNAVDYLLKPFDEEQLSHTIERLEKKLMDQGYQRKTWTPTKLAIEEDGDIRYLDPNDILYVYREGRVTKVVGKSRSYEVNWPLKEVEARLTPFSFFRIHKSYLVNLDYIERLIPWFNGAYQLELRGHKEKLSVSRNYVKNLRNQLEL